MKKFILIIAVSLSLSANAQNYLISFTGTGASTSVSTIKVENLTKGTSLTINGSDILRLTGSTGINPVKDNQSSKLKIYPNPMTDNSTLEVFPPVAGNTVITVYEMTGKPVTQIKSNLENARQDYRISGVKNGLYIISVKGNNYQLSGILLSNSKSNGTIKIEKINSIFQAVDEKTVNTNSKGTSATIDMAYSSGDRLKFTGMSGNFSTVITDKPTSDKTVNFNFVFCSDRDNNNYSVVVIGTQTWMAENLKTTKYNDGTPIPLVTDNNAWAAPGPGYCWYKNEEANFKDTYGALYSWYAVNTEKLCPSGWYLPYDTDWKVLTDYLTNNGYGNGGSGSDIAKSLAASTNWYSSSTEPEGSVCYDLVSNNSTGFTALPAGNRSSTGEFSGLGYLGNWWSLYKLWFYFPPDEGSPSPYMIYWDKTVNTGNTSRQSGQSVRCVLGKSLTTTGVKNNTETTAISGGNIKSDAGAPITARGVCWSTSANPTVADNRTTDGVGIGLFTSSITGLASNTTYHVRSYFTNNFGTTYGDDLIFKTATGTLTDIEGNVYQTVKIGTQTWTAGNLKTTKYSDGTTIPLVSDSTLWPGLTTPAYRWYSNNETVYKDTFGAFYNWYTINTGKLCPSGWHVPADAEWTILTDYLINNGYGYGGSGNYIAKSMAATSGWHNYLESGDYIPGNYQEINNSSGFTGIPIASQAHWWSATEYSTSSVWGRFLYYKFVDVLRLEEAKTSSFPVRCLQGELQVLPVLTTTSVSNITTTTASSGGNILNNISTTVSARGMCWSTSPNPTIANNKTVDGTGTGSFTSSITGLTPGTTYYARAYATNIYAGTAYGNEIQFLTVVTDNDGNVYNTVKIGTQVWMTGNLKTTRYRNGDLIGTTTPYNKDIISESTPSYQWAYAGNENNVVAYGRLYTWFAVNDSRNLCPTGWHVSSHEEWATLADHLGGLSISGGKLKEAGYTHWQSPNTGATNESGFTALPGGFRLSNGGFGGSTTDGLWWNSTESAINEGWTIGMGNTYTAAYAGNNSKRSGYSVRCIQGEIQVLPTLTTRDASSITKTGATSGGNITSDGGAPVTARGVCWSTSLNPTISNNRTTDGGGNGTYFSSITGLSANTTYYVRAYATNSVGTNYGSQVSFTTPATSIILTTMGISSITSTTATGIVNIISDGGITISSRGVCWSTSANPTIANNKTTDGTGTGIFSSSITGLSSNNTYYVRAYATNSEGTEYSPAVILKTSSGTVTDVDGNVYQTVIIGTQTWMADNLKTTRYNDGTAIPLITNSTSWAILSTPGYCWYDNVAPGYKTIYGTLYNSYSVYPSGNGGKNVCPSGWHVPAVAEWTVLTDYLTNNGYGYGGSGNDIAKSMAATMEWSSSPQEGFIGNNQAGNNSSGFTGYPAGYRSGSGDFEGARSSTYWFTMENQYYSLIWNASVVNKDVINKRSGYSIRCLKNN